MLDENIKWSDWWDLMVEFGACIMPKEYEKWNEYTIGETLKLNLTKQESLDYEIWALWALETIFDKLSTTLVSNFISKIISPSRAYDIKQKLSTTLSKNDSSQLESIYKDKLYITSDEYKKDEYYKDICRQISINRSIKNALD